MKQFYMLPSGMPQIGDFLILGSVLLYVITGGSLTCEKEDKYLKIFIIFVFIINGAYFAFNNSTTFLISTFYYFFNYLIVLLIQKLIKIEGFAQQLERVLEIDILVQLVVFLLGRGRFHSGVRYMGTFNDPNQYSFFIFGAMLLITLLKHGRGKNREVLLWYMISLFLIFQASSTGMLLGFLVFIILYVLFSTKTLNGGDFLMIIAAGLIILIGLAIVHGDVSLPSSISESYMMQRVEQKLDDFSGGSSEVLRDRQWTKVVEYPLYTLIGAGEGAFDRFGNKSEIHSSVLGPLWYYGFIPFSIWVRWCIEKMKKVDIRALCIYGALIVESFTLVNNRQPFFWMIYALAGFSLLQRRNVEIERRPRYVNDDF